MAIQRKELNFLIMVDTININIFVGELVYRKEGMLRVVYLK
jgi:hypothetical protein